VLPNTWHFVVTYLAGLGAGATVVPLNPTSPASELQRELAVTQARAAVVGPGASEAFAGVDRGALPLERVFVPAGTQFSDAEPLEPLFSETPVPIVEREGNDLAALLFTAGTSGPSRPAMLTHENLLSNMRQVQASGFRALGPDDVGLGVLPLFHIFGLNVVLGLSLYSGSSVVLEERFDPVSSLELIRDHGVTILAGAPPMFVGWATVPSHDGLASPETMRSVRLAVSGAAKLPEDVARAFEARFGVKVSEGYGLTEASPIVTSSAGDEPRYGSIGVPIPGVEVRLVDEEGEDALVGDPGEIWVRGPNVFAGYLDDDEATARALTTDGWLRTGDVAVADDDGYLYIVDRAKDLIIVSGFNVFPAEVEEVLVDHPGIARAVVVGADHPYSGETVRAFVVPEEGQLLEENEVIAFCARRLARYKCPTMVTFVDELPTGLAGKALRRALK
jgi:long-chain acyl-CoA synthetase